MYQNWGYCLFDIIKERRVKCFVNCKIDAGGCYDIQMVRNRYIKPEVLSELISLENADSICTFCKFNLLPESDDLADVLNYVKNELPYPSQISNYGFVIHFHDSLFLNITILNNTHALTVRSSMRLILPR